MSPNAPHAFKLLTTAELMAQAVAALPWLWHGYLAPGRITLLTSQWKMGKTTLLAALLAKMQTGGMLAELPVAAGHALAISEENPTLWAGRAQRFGLTRHQLVCQPFQRKPTADDWHGLIDWLAPQRQAEGLDLVVIDTLATFLPGYSESIASQMLDALMPLQALTAQGMAVLLMHHPRKDESLEGQAARGTGALPANVDILMEMQWVGRASDRDRRRRLLAWSRHDETPRRRVIELNAAGTDYTVAQDCVTKRDGRDASILLGAFECCDAWPTQEELLANWPEDVPKPRAVTLWRWLNRALDNGLLQRRGDGTKTEPYRYAVVEEVVE